MEVTEHKVCNPEKLVKISIYERIHEILTRVDQRLKYIEDLKPEICADFVKALCKNLENEVGDFHLGHQPFDEARIFTDLENVVQHSELKNLSLRFIFKHLGLLQNYQDGVEEIEVQTINNIAVYERFTYYCAKSSIDVLGEEEGISLWKTLVKRRVEEDNIEYEKRKRDHIAQGKKIHTCKECVPFNVEFWTEQGLADFVVAVLDEHKVLYRFDRCLVPEVLKDVKNSNLAYLSTCYVGDIPEYNIGKIRGLRRTQTLHHGDFCDELYWDQEFHDNPEQPSLEFTRKLSEKE